MAQSVQAFQRCAEKDTSVSGSSQVEPGWVDGLRQIYGAVVDEPLPPAFETLLQKLDEAEDAKR